MVNKSELITIRISAGLPNFSVVLCEYTEDTQQQKESNETRKEIHEERKQNRNRIGNL